MQNKRLAWLDASRGIGLLLMIPAIVRLALHPIGESWAPKAGAAWWSYWLAVETVSDETGIWILAICAGAGLAIHRSTFDDEQLWTATHRARYLILMPVALAHAYYFAPWSVLASGCLAALMMTQAIRETTARPVRTGIAVAAVPVLLIIGHMVLWNAYVERSGEAWDDRFQMSNTEYERWESASYTGDWESQTSVRKETWWQRTTTLGPARHLWQMAGGILIGLWWHRAGRHRSRAGRDAWRLTTGGLTANALGALLVWSELQPGTTARLADMFNYVGGGMLAIGIVALATTANTDFWSNSATSTLRSIGRHSLTLYASLTAALAATAHGWGAGLHGALDAQQTFSVCVISAAAMSAGAALRSGNRRGPAEKWWRRSADRLVKKANQPTDSAEP